MEQTPLQQRRARALGPAYRLFYDEPVHLVRGTGVWLYDAQGRRYLDCYNNVASVGHCHPRVVAALGEQAAQLNTHTRYLHERIVEYAERLSATMPDGLDVCMFACSGTEANDLALRIARAVSGNEGVIVMEQAYHGTSSTVFQLSPEDYPANEQPAFLETLIPPNGYRGVFRYSDPEMGASYAALVDGAVDRLASRGFKPSMFISDNIFSSNGILTPPPEYLSEVYRRVRAAGGLVVADEVQSGLCRLGENYWAFDDSSVVPDIVTAGKPLGDGHPLSVVVTTAEIAASFAERYHYFNTCGGNPVSAAVGLAVLDVIEEEQVLSNVHATGHHLHQGLLALQKRFECIGDVRGKGLFYGVELVVDRETREPAASDAAKVREFLRKNDVLLSVTGPLNNVVKIRPPMIFSRSHADLLLENLEKAMIWLN
jgi:4-aminobutyrate aminotransferase-like enzyme